MLQPGVSPQALPRPVKRTQSPRDAHPPPRSVLTPPHPIEAACPLAAGPVGGASRPTSPPRPALPICEMAAGRRVGPCPGSDTRAFSACRGWGSRGGGGPAFREGAGATGVLRNRPLSCLHLGAALVICSWSRALSLGANVPPIHFYERGRGGASRLGFGTQRALTHLL